MKKLALFLVLLFTVYSCDNEDPVAPDTSLNQILPIGDSRVDGARPAFESYRYELWKLLVDSELEFDMVGPYTDADHVGGYADYQGRSFDDDHAGVVGFETEDVLRTMNFILLSVPQPDIVLLGIGGNDLLAEDPISEVIENINEIIDQLQATNENLVIVLEQIAPARSDAITPEQEQLLNEFNATITTVAEQQSTNSSPVIVVDMSANWSDEYMADALHYNEEGARVVAQRYFDAFVQYLDE
ncbi:MAG: hypothetical protein ED557_12345 [Balneola sp.]|nr:MAG: hypothetical protein ED557_12345 [Balneola sp.]